MKLSKIIEKKIILNSILLPNIFNFTRTNVYWAPIIYQVLF